MVVVLLALFVCLLVESIDPDHVHSHADPHASQLPPHDCMHHKLRVHEKKHDDGLRVRQVTPGTRHEKRSNIQTTSLKPYHDPIRIHISLEALLNDPYSCRETGQQIMVFDWSQTSPYICQAQDVLTEYKMQYLMDRLLASAVQFLESTLKVVRSNQNLTLDILSCAPTPLEVTVPESLRNVGVEADFILLPTARPIIGGSTLAFAASCASNNINRPICGQVNFNTSNLVDNPIDFARQRGVTIHEICHALGFTRDKFEEFITYEGYDSAQDEWLFSVQPSNDIIRSIYDRGNFYEMLTTPVVTRTVQDYFGCDSAPGCALEDGGSSGTRSSHIEKRLFFNDFMTGSDSDFPVYSNITFAVFEDSGWYEVNYEPTEPLLWGKKMGCEFLDDCGGWAKIPGIPMGYCDQTTDPDQVYCSHDRRSYGFCNIIRDRASSLPVYYQHFESPKIGGQSLLTDFCGYIGQRGNTIFCNLGNENTVRQTGDVIKAVADTGETFDFTSRCMFSTISKANGVIDSLRKSISAVFTPQLRSARCYNTSCIDEDDLRIQIDEVWYSCDHGYVYPINWAGAVECPTPREVCGGVRRDLTWPRMQSVYPKSGPPSTPITIIGQNFDLAPPYQVFVEGECTNVTVLDRFTITAIIPDHSYFIGVGDLTAFQSKKDVVVRDSRGYTAHFEKAFTVEVVFDGVYIGSVAVWMGYNPLWGFLVWLLFLVPCFCICLGCYKGLYIRRNKNARQSPANRVQDWQSEDSDIFDLGSIFWDNRSTVSENEQEKEKEKEKEIVLESPRYMGASDGDATGSVEGLRKYTGLW